MLGFVRRVINLILGSAWFCCVTLGSNFLLFFQTCITIACSCIFALHCIAWPYNEVNRWANEIEAVYLFALMMLANVQSIESDNIRHTVSILVLLLTYVFGVLFFFVKAVRFFRQFIQKKRNTDST